jgi:hypothetical protein
MVPVGEDTQEPATDAQQLPQNDDNNDDHDNENDDHNNALITRKKMKPMRMKKTTRTTLP